MLVTVKTVITTVRTKYVKIKNKVCENKACENKEQSM